MDASPAKSSHLPPFDQRFIEEHQLVERYLQQKLPYKGQRDLENWCRSNPEYLQGMRLAERTHASLKLLEASGKPQDLSEKGAPWWQDPRLLIGAAVVTLASVLACATLAAKNSLLRTRLDDAHQRLSAGTLAAPTRERSLRLAPDRSADAHVAKLSLTHDLPELIDLRVDMNYSTEKRFRVTIDKRNEARALVIGAVTRDSNGDLVFGVNSAAFGPGSYDVRIEALPILGDAYYAGSLTLEVH